MSQLVGGQILDGRYRIGATIAHDGMSTVYCATGLRLDRRMTAKVMSPRFIGDGSFRAHFERKTRAVAHLNDESLVSVYDQDTDPAGHAFLIMEFVDGGALRKLLCQRGPMPPRAATAVMCLVLRALSVAHSRGMVHRDIRPENVLIASDGRVRLADFSLVHATTNTKMTSNLVIVGTVAYPAPEQATGESISPASDVYAAGVLLFELLIGTTPFIADSSLGAAMKRLNEDVPPPSELIDSIPEESDELAARACSRRPGDRFETAEKFGDALEDIAGRLALPPFRVPSPVDSAAVNTAAMERLTEDFHRPGNDHFDDRYGTAETAPERFGYDGYGFSTGAPGSPVSSRPPGPPNIFDDLDGPKAPEYPLPPDTQSPQHPQHPQPRSAQTPKSRRATRQRTCCGYILWLIIALVATLGMKLGAW